MKFLMIKLLILFAPTILCAQTSVKAELDLNKVENDRLQVLIYPEGIEADEIIYRMPKIIPGTYKVYNFGRFITDLNAVDKNGKRLSIEKLDENSWRIKNAKSLATISYLVDDTYDREEQDNPIFEPAGTNIEHNKNYLLNTFGFIGYFEGKENIPYKLIVKRPRHLYGASAIESVTHENEKDIFTITDYRKLADSPILYAKPDTALLNIGGTEVIIAIYAENDSLFAPFISNEINDILLAQQQFLGGKLPASKYAFLIYLTNSSDMTKPYGALEHMTSSVYYFPILPKPMFSQMLKNVSAHEFFHILTPLSIHSEEIANFDFNTPKMSKHLWLYEGVTEYFSTLVQVRYDLMTQDQFLKEMKQKILISKHFNNDIALTELSKNVLEKYPNEYQNIYLKGALTAMALDIRLRELSNGTFGLPDLMLKLKDKYGLNNPFKDNELFDVIVGFSYPQIREFIDKYIDGSEPLPYQELFAKVGVIFQVPTKEPKITFGLTKLMLHPKTKRIAILEEGQLDDFGRKLKLSVNDQLLSVNGEEITPQNLNEILSSYLKETKQGDKVKLKVLRTVKGKEKVVKLKAKAFPVEVELPADVQLHSNASENQLALRNSWLKAKN